MTTRTQTIFRAVHGKENPYFMYRRQTAQDNRLSFEARGMLAYLLSKPDDWEISEADLRKEGQIGRDKTKHLIAELVKYGYMVKEQPHDSDKGRFLQNVYIAYEIPLTENPLTVKPLTVNPQEHNIDLLESTEEQTSADALPDDFRPIQDYTVEVVYRGNSAAYGSAGEIANWALCRNDKTQWRDWAPDRQFTFGEWKAFLAWYSDKGIAFPSSPEKWNKQAYEFRLSNDYRRYMRRANPTPPPPDPFTQEFLDANARELMTPFGGGA